MSVGRYGLSKKEWNSLSEEEKTTIASLFDDVQRKERKAEVTCGRLGAPFDRRYVRQLKDALGTGEKIEVHESDIVTRARCTVAIARLKFCVYMDTVTSSVR